VKVGSRTREGTRAAIGAGAPRRVDPSSSPKEARGDAGVT
jgi:hypothetical protein